MLEEEKSLKKKILTLEEKLEHLRVSRRVLMNLVERLEKEKQDEIGRLEGLNRKLKESNSRYARYLIDKNKKIIELKETLESGTASS